MYFITVLDRKRFGRSLVHYLLKKGLPSGNVLNLVQTKYYMTNSARNLVQFQNREAVF